MTTTITPEPTGPEPTPAAPRTAEDVLAVLRTDRRRVYLFAGFGPLAVAALVAVAMMLLAPSIAPERIVGAEVDPNAVTTTTTTDAGIGG